MDPNGYDGGGQGFDMNDIFSMFGQQQQQRGGGSTGPVRGSDIQMRARLSFMEAVLGTTRDLDLVSSVTCEPCKGSGAKAGTKAKVCRICKGIGSQTMQQGIFAIETPCRACGGEGSKIEYFIVSQVNIHYKFIFGYNSFGTSVVADLLLYMKKQMKAYMKHAAKLGFNTSFLRILRIGWIPFLTQSYEGDITICPVRACSVGCGRNQQKRPFYAG